MPRPDPAYLAFVSDRVLEAARIAKRNLNEADLAWCSSSFKAEGGNRTDPNGPTDPEVGILAMRSKGRPDPDAVLLVYGMHPTVLHEDSTLVSSDFPHYVRHHLSESLGATVLYHTAP